MFARYAIALGIGAAVTFGLLFIMQLLIASGRGDYDADRERRNLDMVRVEREQVIERKQRKPEKPPEPQKPPETPTTSFESVNTSIAVSVTQPTFNNGLDIGGIGIGVSDGEYLPIVKVAPVYPARAAQRGIEGHVIVEFTVTRTGTTRDIRVVESTSSLFDRSAIEAAGKFKYKPRYIDGEPVEVPGVRNQITFVLEQ